MGKKLISSKRKIIVTGLISSIAIFVALAFTFSFSTLPPSRTVLIHVPEGYTATEPTPVVFMLHGSGAGAEDAQNAFGFNALSDREKFIAVYPQGMGDEEHGYDWNGGDCCGQASKDKIDDISFLKQTYLNLKKNYNVDTSRVYIAGFSAGGIMAYRAGCELPDIFASIGVQSGALAVESCSPSTPISVIHIHGSSDEVVPYDGGYSASERLVFKSVDESVNTFVSANRCITESEDESILSGPRNSARIGVQISDWDPCAEGTGIRLVRIAEGNHAWAGNLNGDVTLGSTEMMWDWFKTHPKGKQ